MQFRSVRQRVSQASQQTDVLPTLQAVLKKKLNSEELAAVIAFLDVSRVLC